MLLSSKVPLNYACIVNYSFLLDILFRHNYRVELALDEFLEVEKARSDYEEAELYVLFNLCFVISVIFT